MPGKSYKIRFHLDRKRTRQQVIREDRQFVLNEVNPTYAEAADKEVAYRGDARGVTNRKNPAPSDGAQSFAEQREEGTANGYSMKENILYGNR